MTTYKRRLHKNPGDKLIEVRDDIRQLEATSYSLRTGWQHRRLKSLKVYAWRLKRRKETGVWL